MLQDWIEVGDPLLDARAARLVTHLAESSVFSDLLGSGDERRDWFRSTTPAVYQRLLRDINAIVRGKDPSAHRFDGANVRVAFGDAVGMIPPAHADKPFLLANSFRAAKRMATQENSVAPSLRPPALLLSGVVNLVHPAADGNGTTGRVMGYLCDQGFLMPERQLHELAVIMSGGGRRFLMTGSESFYAQVSQGVIRQEISAMDVDFHDPQLPRGICWDVLDGWTSEAVSYTHLTLPTNREV